MRWYRHIEIEKIKKLSYMFWMREFVTWISLGIKELIKEDMTDRKYWESFAFILIQMVFLPVTFLFWRWYTIDRYYDYGLSIYNNKNIWIMENIKCK